MISAYAGDTAIPNRLSDAHSAGVSVDTVVKESNGLISSGYDTNRHSASGSDINGHSGSIPDTNRHSASGPNTNKHSGSGPDTNKYSGSVPDTNRHSASGPKEVVTILDHPVDNNPKWQISTSTKERGSTGQHSGKTDSNYVAGNAGAKGDSSSFVKGLFAKYKFKKKGSTNGKHGASAGVSDGIRNLFPESGEIISPYTDNEHPAQPLGNSGHSTASGDEKYQVPNVFGMPMDTSINYGSAVQKDNINTVNHAALNNNPPVSYPSAQVQNRFGQSGIQTDGNGKSTTAYKDNRADHGISDYEPSVHKSQEPVKESYVQQNLPIVGYGQDIPNTDYPSSHQNLLTSSDKDTSSYQVPDARAVPPETPYVNPGTDGSNVPDVFAVPPETPSVDPGIGGYQVPDAFSIPLENPSVDQGTGGYQVPDSSVVPPELSSGDKGISGYQVPDASAVSPEIPSVDQSTGGYNVPDAFAVPPENPYVNPGTDGSKVPDEFAVPPKTPSVDQGTSGYQVPDTIEVPLETPSAGQGTGGYNVPDSLDVPPENPFVDPGTGDYKVPDVFAVPLDTSRTYGSASNTKVNNAVDKVISDYQLQANNPSDAASGVSQKVTDSRQTVANSNYAAPVWNTVKKTNSDNTVYHVPDFDVIPTSKSAKYGQKVQNKNSNTIDHAIVDYQPVVNNPSEQLPDPFAQSNLIYSDQGAVLGDHKANGANDRIRDYHASVNKQPYIAPDPFESSNINTVDHDQGSKDFRPVKTIDVISDYQPSINGKSNTVPDPFGQMKKTIDNSNAIYDYNNVGNSLLKKPAKETSQSEHILPNPANSRDMNIPPPIPQANWDPTHFDRNTAKYKEKIRKVTDALKQSYESAPKPKISKADMEAAQFEGESAHSAFLGLLNPWGIGEFASEQHLKSYMPKYPTGAVTVRPDPITTAADSTFLKSQFGYSASDVSNKGHNLDMTGSTDYHSIHKTGSTSNRKDNVFPNGYDPMYGPPLEALDHAASGNKYGKSGSSGHIAPQRNPVNDVLPVPIVGHEMGYTSGQSHTILDPFNQNAPSAGSITDYDVAGNMIRQTESSGYSSIENANKVSGSKSDFPPKVVFGLNQPSDGSNTLYDAAGNVIKPPVELGYSGVAVNDRSSAGSNVLYNSDGSIIKPPEELGYSGVAVNDRSSGGNKILYNSGGSIIEPPEELGYSGVAVIDRSSVDSNVLYNSDGSIIKPPVELGYPKVKLPAQSSDGSNALYGADGSIIKPPVELGYSEVIVPNHQNSNTEAGATHQILDPFQNIGSNGDYGAEMGNSHSNVNSVVKSFVDVNKYDNIGQTSHQVIDPFDQNVPSTRGSVNSRSAGYGAQSNEKSALSSKINSGQKNEISHHILNPFETSEQQHSQTGHSKSIKTQTFDKLQNINAQTGYGSSESGQNYGGTGYTEGHVSHDVIDTLGQSGHGNTKTDKSINGYGNTGYGGEIMHTNNNLGVVDTSGNKNARLGIDGSGYSPTINLDSGTSHQIIDPATWHQIIDPATSHQIIDPATSHQIIDPATSHQILDPATSHQIIDPATSHQIIDAATSHQIIETAPSHQIIDPATSHQIIDPATSHQIIDPATSHQIIDPATSHQSIDAATSHQIKDPATLHQIIDPFTNYRTGKDQSDVEVLSPFGVNYNTKGDQTSHQILDPFKQFAPSNLKIHNIKSQSNTYVGPVDYDNIKAEDQIKIDNTPASDMTYDQKQTLYDNSPKRSTNGLRKHKCCNSLFQI